MCNPFVHLSQIQSIFSINSTMSDYLWSSFLIAANAIFLLILLSKRRRMAGEPPLVSHVIPFIGAAFDFGRAPLTYLQELQKAHGDVFTIKLAGWNVHVFMNPLDVRNLERTRSLDHTEIIGDFVTRMVGFPHSIHNNAGKSIEKAEKNKTETYNTNSPEFNNKEDVSKRLIHSIEKNLRGSMQLSELCDSCKSVVVTALERTLKPILEKNQNQTVKLYEFCKALVFDITFNLLFGSLQSLEESTNETRQFYSIFQVYFKRSALLVDRVPIHLLPDTKKARTELLGMMKNIKWSERRNVSQLITDLVNVDPRIDFADQRARHLLIVLWSAQANTAPALFWILYHLLANRDAQRAVKVEYKQMCNKAKQLRRRHSSKNLPLAVNNWPLMTNILNIDKTVLDKMVILDGCLKETMRLSGSSMSLRKTAKDTKIKTESGKTFVLRKGDYTTFFAPVTHMDPGIFHNPKDYIHDRFLCEADASSSSSCASANDNDSSTITSGTGKLFGQLKHRSKFFKDGKGIAASRALMTFGFGSTRCPGRHIAMIEIKLVVLALLQYFNVAITDRNSETPDFDLSHLGFGVMPPNTDVDINIKLAHCLNA